MQLTDHKLEVAIGRLLQTGVFLSAFLVLAGGLLYLHQAVGLRPDYSHFHGVAEALRSPSGIAKNALRGDAESIIQLGLLLLIATPVARVVLAAGGFLVERDRMYFWVSLAVLAVLLFSLLHVR